VRSLIIVLLALLPAAAALQSQAPPAEEPKLILFVAIDQFRYDYLPRFRDEYTGGLKTLLDHGASFANAHLEHYPSVTAAGHATMLSGATPGLSGIIGNDWYDRASNEDVTSVSDKNSILLGISEAASGSTPHRLLVSTVGDELKRSGSPDSRVFGISMKDRGAILPAGHMANGAYWYHSATGAFVSSDYYYSVLPRWATTFNAERHAEDFAGKTWLKAAPGTAARVMPASPGRELNGAIYSTPFGNDILELFAEQLIRAERLGQRGVTDLLTISFSANDSVGHAYGPDSREVHAVSLSVDLALGRLFDALDESVGMDNVLVVMTADHSVSPLPEVLKEQRLPGGRVAGDFFARATAALQAQYGAGEWIEGTAGTAPYFNYDLMDQQGIDHAEAENVVADAMRKHPQVARVYTRQQFLNGRSPVDAIDSRVLRSFHPRRSGDLEIVLDPFWIRSGSGTTHGSPYNYDTHIPLIFMGPGIKPGRYYKAVALNDAAPTISALLDIEMPSGSVGRILDEIIK
jgi:predicted AlkP superfamily pyrophosphatase or phosphodiesterase